VSAQPNGLALVALFAFLGFAGLLDVSPGPIYLKLPSVRTGFVWTEITNMSKVWHNPPEICE